MLNFTDKMFLRNETDDLPPFQPVLWNVTFGLNVVSLVMTFWLVYTIGIYGVKSGKFQRKRKSDYSGGMILKILFAISICALPRFASTLVLTWIGFNPGSEGDYICETVMDITIGTYYLALLPVYIFLWMRQRSLFQQPSINRLYSTTVKGISWGSLLFLIVAGVGIVVVFVVPKAYLASPRGCILTEEEAENVTVFYILLVVLLTGQITLLALFIYPLHLHRNVQVTLPTSSNKNVINRSTVISNDWETSYQTEEDSVDKLSSSQLKPKSMSSTFARFSIARVNRVKSMQTKKARSVGNKKNTSVNTSQRLKRVMVRSVVSALICIISDLAASGVVGFIISEDAPKNFTNTIYDISLMVNIISVICSFESYAKIFKAPFTSSSAPRKTLVTLSGTHSVNTEDSKARYSS